MISDSSGVMVYGRYDQFLQEVLKLPTAVFEGPSFGYTEQAARSCFSQQVGKTWVFLLLYVTLSHYSVSSSLTQMPPEPGSELITPVGNNRCVS